VRYVTTNQGKHIDPVESEALKHSNQNTQKTASPCTVVANCDKSPLLNTVDSTNGDHLLAQLRGCSPLAQSSR